MPRLNPVTRLEVARLLLTGATQVALAAKFGTSVTSIWRVAQALRDGTMPIPGPEPEIQAASSLSRLAPPPPPPPEDQLQAATLEELDPVRFRRVKLTEIGEDLSTARNLGRVQALAGLHRLHIEVHDQAVACIESRGDDVSGLSSGEQERIIFSELSRLPVSMRHRLLDHLEALDAGKVLSMPEPRRTGKGEA
tara:strand:- start:24076 stop:24657 length:582 start_codon:yes stop_codon:yes gene_type:complete